MSKSRCHSSYVKVAVSLALVFSAGAAGVAPAGAGAASCSGHLASGGFTFSCDTDLGNNDSGSAFSITFASASVTGGDVSSPSGLQCGAGGRRGTTSNRLTCSGAVVRAGTTVTGSVTLSSGSVCHQSGVALRGFGPDDPEADTTAVYGPFTLAGCPTGPVGGGGQACVVPKLKGKTLSAAKNALSSAHCRLGKVTRKHHKGKRGRVLSQDPGPGKRLAGGAKVSVVVSKH